MDAQFIKLIHQVVSERGKNVVTNKAVFNSLLADYARGKYTRERRLFIRELQTKSYDDVMKSFLPPPVPLKPTPQSVPAPAVKPSAQKPGGYDNGDFDEDEFGAPDDDTKLVNEGHHERPSKNGGAGYTIKCPKCGAEYSITDKRTLRCFEQGFLCDDCGASWKVAFFGVCARCKENVGFDTFSWVSGLTYLGTTFLDALNKQDNFFTKINDMANDLLPQAVGFGVCPICKQEHALCPKCGGAAPFSTAKQGQGKVIKCKSCGRKVKL